MDFPRLKKTLGRLEKALVPSKIVASAAERIREAPSSAISKVTAPIRAVSKKASAHFNSAHYNAGLKILTLINPQAAAQRFQTIDQLNTLIKGGTMGRFGEALLQAKYQKNGHTSETNLAKAKEEIQRMRKISPASPAADISQSQYDLFTGNFKAAERSILAAHDLMANSPDSQKVLGQRFWETYHDVMLVQGEKELAQQAQKKLSQKFDRRAPSIQSFEPSLRPAKLYNTAYGYNGGTGLESPEEIAKWRTSPAKLALGKGPATMIGSMAFNRQLLEHAMRDKPAQPNLGEL